MLNVRVGLREYCVVGFAGGGRVEILSSVTSQGFTEQVTFD